jgi:hypothetical protein
MQFWLKYFHHGIPRQSERETEWIRTKTYFNPPTSNSTFVSKQRLMSALELETKRNNFKIHHTKVWLFRFFLESVSGSMYLNVSSNEAVVAVLELVEWLVVEVAAFVLALSSSRWFSLAVLDVVLGVVVADASPFFDVDSDIAFEFGTLSRVSVSASFSSSESRRLSLLSPSFSLHVRRSRSPELRSFDRRSFVSRSLSEELLFWERGDRPS